MPKTNVLSFKELKERISLEHVLRHHGLFEGLKLRAKAFGDPAHFVKQQTVLRSASRWKKTASSAFPVMRQEIFWLFGNCRGIGCKTSCLSR